MARSRNIKPGFFMNEVLAECPMAARIVFAGLWTLADRAGRLEDRPKKIKAEILPYDDYDVDVLLNDLSEKGFITRYSVGNNNYIQIDKFSDHQNPHQKEAASTIPAPDSPEARSGKTGASRADSLNLIPDSLNLIPSTDETKAALEEYNALAGRTGLPQVQMFSPERKTALKGRLAECGGIDGWKAALGKVEGNQFLLGANSNGWKADFDFLVKKKNFIKLMEGGYDRSTKSPPKKLTAFEENMEAAGFGGSK